MPGTLTRPVLKNRELLPPGGKRRERTAAQVAAAGDHLDYPATQVGVVGNITVYYDASLGPQGLALATQMLNFVIRPYVDMEALFGVSGAPFSIVIAPLSGKNDGSGGAYHYGCDFNSGGVLYLDATFASTTVAPWALEIGLYVAELSECFMGTQNLGWGCGYSNGEALSRFCAERETPAGTLNAFATGPTWDQAGRPDWISKTEQTDQDGVSTGCGIVYLYWMRSLGFTVPAIVQAGGATLAANYQTLTGKTTAYQDLLAAVNGMTITSDNPFGPPPGLKWNTDDLTAETGAALAASNPSGYMFVAQGTQHAVYRDVNGHIQELWWNGVWNNDDITAQTNAPLAAGDPSGYMYDVQATQHVMYRDVNGHIQELWWNGTWNNDDVTAQTNAPSAAGDPKAYMFAAQDTQHVVYRATDNHIHELWWG